MADVDRHDRQTRLDEVGAAGQRRIAACSVDLPLVGLAGEVAARYLAGAGVGRLRVRDAALSAAARSVDSTVRVEIDDTPARLSHAAEGDACDAVGFRDPSAREVAVGARGALRALRAAIAKRSGEPCGP